MNVQYFCVNKYNLNLLMKVQIPILILIGLLSLSLAEDFEKQEEALFRAHNKARSDPFYYKEIVSNEYNTKFTMNEVDKFAICYDPKDYDA